MIVYSNQQDLSNISSDILCSFIKKVQENEKMPYENEKMLPESIKTPIKSTKELREDFYKDFDFVCKKLGYNADIRGQVVAYEIALKNKKHLQDEEQLRVYNARNIKQIPFTPGLSKKLKQYPLHAAGEVWRLGVNPATQTISTKSKIGRKYRAFVMEDCKVVSSTVFESQVWLSASFSKKGYGFRNAEEFAQHTALIEDDHNRMVRREAWNGRIKKLVVVLNGRKKGCHEAEKFLVCNKKFSIEALNKKQGMEAWTLNIDVAEGTNYQFVGMFLRELLYKSELFPSNMRFFLQMPLNSKKEDKAYHAGVLQASGLTPCIKHKEWMHWMGHIQLRGGKVRSMQGNVKEIKAVKCTVYDATSQKTLESAVEVKDIATSSLNEMYQVMMAAQTKQNELKSLEIKYPENRKKLTTIKADFKGFMNRTRIADTVDPGYLKAIKDCEDERAGWTDEYRAQKEAENRAAIEKTIAEAEAEKQRIRDAEKKALLDARSLTKALAADAYAVDYSRMKKPQEHIDRMEKMYRDFYGKPYPPMAQMTKDFCIGMYGQPDIPQWILEAEQSTPEEVAI